MVNLCHWHIAQSMCHPHFGLIGKKVENVDLIVDVDLVESLVGDVIRNENNKFRGCVYGCPIQYCESFQNKTFEENFF
jgi:hypothetical protein